MNSSDTLCASLKKISDLCKQTKISELYGLCKLRRVCCKRMPRDRQSCAAMRTRRAFFIFCSLVGLTTVVCIFWWELSMVLIAVTSPKQISCYWGRSSDIMELGQGEWDKEMLIPSRCIFFHEISCSPPNLTSRQACAVESAARNNRNLNVFLFLFATGQPSEKSKGFVKILETYDNVYIRRVRLSTYVIDTPIENWFSANIRRYSGNHDWLCKDFYDYVRMLTIWKFGGVTLNLNSVVLASLDELTTFAGVRDNRDMSVGVFGVDTSTNFGRRFADACMEVIKDTNANDYSRYNITRVITEAVRKLCYQRNDRECRRFTIYPPEKFYPACPASRHAHPNEVRAEEMVKMDAVTIHLWKDYGAEVDNVAAYKMAAGQHCPKIYEFVGESF